MVSGSAAHSVLETLEPVGCDTPLGAVGGGVQSGKAWAAGGIDAFGHHVRAADVEAVDDAHAGGAELGVQVPEDPWSAPVLSFFEKMSHFPPLSSHFSNSRNARKGASGVRRRLCFWAG